MTPKFFVIFATSLAMCAPLRVINPEPDLDPQNTTGNSQKEQRGAQLSALEKPADTSKGSASAAVLPSCPGIAKFPERLTWDAECKPESPTFVKKKCLYIPDLLLRGSVKDPAGNVVVVVGNAKHPGQHPLFLQENDELFNAKVEKIAADKITFCEYADSGGSKNPHEVTVAIPVGSLKPAGASNNQQKSAESKSRVVQRKRVVEPGDKVLGGCTAGPYSGSKFDFHLNSLDVATFLRLMHDVAGLNFVRDSGVKGTVTLEANSMPWDQALGLAMRGNGLECELDRKILRVVTLETLKEDVDRATATKSTKTTLVSRQTSCFPDEYNGLPLTINVDDLALQDFFRLMQEVAHSNSDFEVVVDPDVKGTVSIGATSRPWTQLLDVVVRSAGFQCQLDGKTLRVSNRNR